MAFDPTPDPSIYGSTPANYATPAQLAQMYAYARNLQNFNGPDNNPQSIKHGGVVGLANALTKGIVSGLTIRNANQLGQGQREAQAQAVEGLGGGGGPQASLGGPQQTASLDAGAAPSAPAEGSDEAYIRAGATQRGLNPDVVVKTAKSEGLGAGSYIGDQGSSFGPFQLHYGNVPGVSKGNSVAGLGDDFTAATGLDARDPSTTRAQIDFSLDHIAKNGLGAWHGWHGDPNAAKMPAQPTQAAAGGDDTSATVKALNGGAQLAGPPPTPNTQSPPPQSGSPAPNGAVPMPQQAAQTVQALAQGTSAQNSPMAPYLHMLAQGIRTGSIDPGAGLAAAMQMRQQMIPQYQDIEGKRYRTQFGEPAQLVGPTPGYHNLAGVAGMPGVSTDTTYDKNANPQVRFVTPGAAPGPQSEAEPSTAVGANTPPPQEGGGTTPPVQTAGPLPQGTRVPPGAEPTPSGGVPQMPTHALPGETPEQFIQRMQQYQVDFAANKAGTVKGNEEVASKLAELQTEPLKAATAKGDVAAKSIQFLRTMRQLDATPDAEKINNGPFAHEFLKVKETLKDLTGFDAGGIASAEGIDKMNGFLASTAAKELTNRPTQFDFKTFLDRNPGITISKEGRGLLMDALESSYEQDKALSDAAQSVKSPGEWPKIRDAVIKAHPIVANFRGKDLTTADQKIDEFQLPGGSSPTAGTAPPGMTIPTAPVRTFNPTTGKLE